MAAKLATLVRKAMDDHINDLRARRGIDGVRRMMLERHALHAGDELFCADGRDRHYCYDRQDRGGQPNFEQRYSKAYIRD
jgi:hypothetical protein